MAAAPAQKQAEQKILLLVHLVPYAVLFPIVILTNEARALLFFEIDAGFQLGILQRQLRLDKVIPGQLLAGLQLVEHIVRYLLAAAGAVIAGAPIVLFLVVVLHIAQQLAVGLVESDDLRA